MNNDLYNKMSVRLYTQTKFKESIPDEKIALNIEISIFNWSLIQTKKKKKNIKASWTDLNFKKMYIQKARSILFNINNKNNVKFKEMIVDGLIDIKTIPFLSSEEIFPELWDNILQSKYEKEFNELHEKENLLKSAVDGQFTCKKCKCKKIHIFSMQTRSADEPMTNFLTCIKCSFRWKN